MFLPPTLKITFKMFQNIKVNSCSYTVLWLFDTCHCFSFHFILTEEDTLSSKIHKPLFLEHLTSYSLYSLRVVFHYLSEFYSSLSPTKKRKPDLSHGQAGRKETTVTKNGTFVKQKLKKWSYMIPKRLIIKNSYWNTVRKGKAKT